MSIPRHRRRRGADLTTADVAGLVDRSARGESLDEPPEYAGTIGEAMQRSEARQPPPSVDPAELQAIDRLASAPLAPPPPGRPGEAADAIEQAAPSFGGDRTVAQSAPAQGRDPIAQTRWTPPLAPGASPPPPDPGATARIAAVQRRLDAGDEAGVAGDLQPPPPASSALSPPAATPRPMTAPPVGVSLHAPQTSAALASPVAKPTIAQARAQYADPYEGLSPDDIRGAEERDAARSILGAIGSGLQTFGSMYAGGGPVAPIEMRHEADAMRSRLAQAQARVSAGKQADEERASTGRAQSIAERRLALQEQRDTRTADAAEARLDLARLREESEARRREAQTAQSEARTDAERIRADRLRQETAEDSPRRRAAAARYTARYRVFLRDEGRPEEDDAQIAEHLRGMDALAIDAATRDLGTRSTGRRGRAGGAGHGGIGAAQVDALREQLRERYGDSVDAMTGRQLMEEATYQGRHGSGGAGVSDDLIAQRAVGLGIAPDVATAQAMMSTTPGRRTVVGQVGSEGARRGRAAARATMPGWHRPEGSRLLSDREASETARIATADREFEVNVHALEGLLSQLTAAERASSLAGLGSERAAEINHRLDVIRNQLRQINSSGNSLGAQQMAEHAIAGLDSRTTASAILANVRAAQRVKHDYVVSVMRTYGYEQGDAPREEAPPATGRVRVRLRSSGQTGTVDASEVDDTDDSGQPLYEAL